MLEAARRLKPELAVVDLCLAKGNLAGLLGRLRRHCPDLKVILLGDIGGPSVAESVLAGGADAFLFKGVVASKLLSAVEAVRRGERYIC